MIRRIGLTTALTLALLAGVGSIAIAGSAEPILSGSTELAGERRERARIGLQPKRHRR